MVPMLYMALTCCTCLAAVGGDSSFCFCSLTARLFSTFATILHFLVYICNPDKQRWATEPPLHRALGNKATAAPSRRSALGNEATAAPRSPSIGKRSHRRATSVYPALPLHHYRRSIVPVTAKSPFLCTVTPTMRSRFRCHEGIHGGT